MTKVLNNIGQMYKVFFNDRTVFINSKAPSLELGKVVSIAISSFDDALKARALLLKDRGPAKLYLYGAPADELLALFSSAFKCINAAGGLLINGDNRLLCIKRMGVWDLPKGKVEKSETIEQAACREVEEETGLKGFYVKQQLESSYHIYQSPYAPYNWIFKTTFWFLMHYEGSAQPVPQSEEAISEVRWFGHENMKEVEQNTYASLRPLFAFYMERKYEQGA